MEERAGAGGFVGEFSAGQGDAPALSTRLRDAVEGQVGACVGEFSVGADPRFGSGAGLPAAAGPPACPGGAGEDFAGEPAVGAASRVGPVVGGPGGVGAVGVVEGTFPDAGAAGEAEPVVAGGRVAAARTWLLLRCGLELRTVLALTAVLVVASLLAVRHYVTGRPRAVPVPAAVSASAPVVAEGPRVAAGKRPDLTVDVAGKVAHPGLRHLPAGSRVADALAAAGGPVRGADTTSLNLARRLADGEQLLVGRPAPPDGAAAMGSASSPDAGPTGPVSLNAATAPQLDALPGVGPVLAQHILDFRNQHGGFTTLQQLRQVPGIGDRKFATLKSLVQP